MLSVTGYGSRIIEELRPLLPPGEQIVASAQEGPVLEEARRFVLCSGLLRPAKLAMQTPEETAEAMEVNCFKPIRLCEHILGRFEDARICVIGSESAYTWSYDDAYAAAKAALHRYVETRMLAPKQQLICIAPSIIEDCGMTTRRTDLENLERRRQIHPKRRFLTAAEVARLIHFVLYTDEGYLSGQVIRMNGGV